MPSCRAASTLAWPAIKPPSSPTSAGDVQPHSLMLAAIAATWASVWVRALRAYGISRSRTRRDGGSVGALLRLAPPRGDHHRNLGYAELPGGEHASMARNQAAILAHQRRRASWLSART